MTSRTERFTALQARRVALAAQGFTRARPAAVTARHVNSVIDKLGLFQIDSVNVLARAHYMPLYSRVGPYDQALLDRAFARTPRRLFEYWAHEAALVGVNLHQALRFRMRSETRMWGSMAQVARDNPGLVEQVLDDVRDHGPVTARQIDKDVTRSRDNWGWNWSAVKSALEYLFYTGEVTSARRSSAFERLYDLPDRVLPPASLGAPDLDADEAHRHLVRFAARAHGIATEVGLRDYFRLAPEPARTAIGELVDAGELLPAGVRGWRRPAYLHPGAHVPRTVRARTLLSPFDPLVFERERTADLFGFRYRIEIYVPADKRVHGYYVLPFLLGDALVGRVDLKADRGRGVLVVPGAYAEPGAPPDTVTELAAELQTVATWLGLSAIEVGPRGDLAAALRSAVG